MAPSHIASKLISIISFSCPTKNAALRSGHISVATACPTENFSVRRNIFPVSNCCGACKLEASASAESILPAKPVLSAQSD